MSGLARAIAIQPAKRAQSRSNSQKLCEICFGKRGKKTGILARLKSISLLVCEWANADVRVGANQSDCSLLGLGLMLLDLECTSNCKACLALHRQQQLHQHQLHQQLA